MRIATTRIRTHACRLLARAAAFVVAGLTLGGTPVVAQETQPSVDNPADGGDGAQALVARITALKGIVQVRAADDQPWKPAAVGMELDEGAEFRTGPRSAVQFVIPPDQTITLDRLGTIKVLQAVKDAGKVTTSLGMKYGRTRYDIKAADLEHDSTIRSPGSTLAIRGTDVTFEDMAPFAPSAVSREGRALFRTHRREFVAVGGKRRAVVEANRRGGPAETALVRTRSDPQSAFSGRSPAEQNALLQLPSYGGHQPGRGGFRDLRRGEPRLTFGGEPIKPGPKPGPTPTPNPAIMPGDIITGRLRFDLDWDGIPFTNVDLTVARGGGEILGPGFNPVPSGGRHLGDEEANSVGVGRESVVWDTSFPADFYYVQVDLKNDAQTRTGLTVTHTPATGSPIVLHQSGPTVLDPRGKLGFGLHVAAPPELPGPPPPLPPGPTMPVGPLPPPQPGPDRMGGQ